MAQHARLEKARLVVERRRSWRPAEAGLRVALQAQQVYIAQLQHVRIRSAVHQMAGLAAVNLHGLMLEHKRPLLVCVAREADRVLRRRSAHLLGPHRAVHVVAIAALDQPFIHPMMKRHIELGFLLQMAGVAQLGLGLYEQKIRIFAVVRRMASNATNVILAM